MSPDSPLSLLAGQSRIKEAFTVEPTSSDPLRGGVVLRLYPRRRYEDIEKIEIEISVREAACLGAAILAGAAAGVYRSVGEGVAATVKPQATFIPEPEMQKQYAQKYHVYRQIYPALTPINRVL